MRRRHKYHLPSSQTSGPASFLYLLLALALVVAVGWIWWESGKKSRPDPKPRSTASTQSAPPDRTNTPPLVPKPAPKPAAVVPSAPPRTVSNIFEAQLALVQRGISPGSLDGVIGSQTRAALTTFQQQQQLPVTGQLDDLTKSRLLLTNDACMSYIVTSNDIARLQPVAPTWLGKSRQSALDFETVLELVAEKSFAHPDFIRRLNPTMDWTNVTAGTVVKIPNAGFPEIRAKAALIRIHLSGKTLEAFDENSNVLAHFPCSIAKLAEKRPVGELRITVIAPRPNYTFDPDVFPESPEAKELNRKLILPPGPNNPVGVAWIGLDRPAYGIHGTPKPEDVGRTESHGCFRLANWNAEYLLRLVTLQTVVYVEE